MQFDIKVKMNSASKIIKDHGLNDDGNVTRFLRDTIYRLYEPYVPRDQGNLYRQVTYPNNHSIKHTVPYARYLYPAVDLLQLQAFLCINIGHKEVDVL